MWQYISFLEVTGCQVVDDSTFHVHLKQTSQWHEMYYRDLEVMSSNPGMVELGVHNTCVLSHTWSKNIG